MGIREAGKWVKAGILGGSLLAGAREVRADVSQAAQEAPIVQKILSSKAALQEAGRLSMEALNSSLGNEEVGEKTEAEKLEAIVKNFGTQTEHNWRSKLKLEDGKLFLEVTITDAKGNEATESYEVQRDALGAGDKNPMVYSLTGGPSREKKAKADQAEGFLAAVRGDIARHAGKGSGDSDGPIAAK
jgi:microcompartment protein CcmK/EutM